MQQLKDVFVVFRVSVSAGIDSSKLYVSSSRSPVDIIISLESNAVLNSFQPNLHGHFKHYIYIYIYIYICLAFMPFRLELLDQLSRTASSLAIHRKSFPYKNLPHLVHH